MDEEAFIEVDVNAMQDDPERVAGQIRLIGEFSEDSFDADSIVEPAYSLPGWSEIEFSNRLGASR